MSSMKGTAKRAVDTLRALGFVLDEDASRRGHQVRRHANDPTPRSRPSADSATSRA